ncbi:hypothetical protein GCK32_016437, partial [Trichostrongylus colubriformis]
QISISPACTNSVPDRSCVHITIEEIPVLLLSTLPVIYQLTIQVCYRFMCSVICACLVLLLLRFSLELTKFAKISVHARDNVGIALADGTGLAIYCDFDLIAIGSRETIAIYNYTLDANNQGMIVRSVCRTCTHK